LPKKQKKSTSERKRRKGKFSLTSPKAEGVGGLRFRRGGEKRFLDHGGTSFFLSKKSKGRRKKEKGSFLSESQGKGNMRPFNPGQKRGKKEKSS